MTAPNSTTTARKSIKVQGTAYDSCLLTPQDMQLANGATRSEYGLNLGLSDEAAAEIERAIDDIQLAQWGHVSSDIISPVYDGAEIGITEPKAITLGSIYKPDIGAEIPDGTHIEIVINIRAYEGQYRHGVVTNLAKIFPAVSRKRFRPQHHDDGEVTA